VRSAAQSHAIDQHREVTSGPNGCGQPDWISFSHRRALQRKLPARSGDGEPRRAGDLPHSKGAAPLPVTRSSTGQGHATHEPPAAGAVRLPIPTTALKARKRSPLFDHLLPCPDVLEPRRVDLRRRAVQTRTLQSAPQIAKRVLTGGSQPRTWYRLIPSRWARGPVCTTVPLMSLPRAGGRIPTTGHLRAPRRRTQRCTCLFAADGELAQAVEERREQAVEARRDTAVHYGSTTLTPW
jgi:hypothetical protein